MASVARVTEISSISPKGFDDAIQAGIHRASQTLRGMQSAWVKEQEVQLDESGQITGYKVNLLVTFVLD
jgi:flavin-binding protein dodecin